MPEWSRGTNYSYAVWPGGVVTDDVLTQCIVEFRKAFGDSARHPKVIQTIPKVGFRLIPAVNHWTIMMMLRLLLIRCKKNQGFSHHCRFGPGGIGAFLVSHGIRVIDPAPATGAAKSIAVLPFVDMSEEGDQAYFADGLTEELTNRLTQLKGLEVAARTSSFYFKDRNEDLRDIARELGVNHLLEGSVRRDGDRLRISAQLIEADNGFHLWSRQYDQPLENYFSVQEEIAEAVAEALSVRLQVGELGSIPGGTSNVEAYQEILLSKQEQWKSTPDSIFRAIEHVKKAIEIDPGYAQAWLRLAGLYINANALLGTEGRAGAYHSLKRRWLAHSACSPD